MCLFLRSSWGVMLCLCVGVFSSVITEKLESFLLLQRSGEIIDFEEIRLVLHELEVQFLMQEKCGKN